MKTQRDVERQARREYYRGKDGHRPTKTPPYKRIRRSDGWVIEYDRDTMVGHLVPSQEIEN